MKRRVLPRDLLNLKFDEFFRYERYLNNVEYGLHDLPPTLNSLLWTRWDDEDGSSLGVAGHDVKHLTFPNLNIPFPLKKRE